MKKTTAYLFILIVLTMFQCKTNNCKNEGLSSISKESINKAIKSIQTKFPDTDKEKIGRGVTQVASLWTAKDGKDEEFIKFCEENFVAGEKEKNVLFERLSGNLEVLFGNMNKTGLSLKQQLHLDIGEIIPVDEIFGSYDPFAHFNDDFFQNKIAFVCALNFPFYSLSEKNKNGEKWSRKEWAYARLGDLFTARIPADITQKVSDAATNSDTYISEYNIYMGNLINDKGDTIFPSKLKLISHWGLRDELKSNYAVPGGIDKQKMIYEVMKRIISQEIPDSVINNKNYTWNPYVNKLYKDKKEVTFKREPDIRYEKLLNNFLALKEMDVYTPQYPTYIQRKFEQEMEIPQPEVEKLFISYLTSPQVKKVATLISSRLGRKLEAFDIWYDGFKSRSSISEDQLNKMVKTKYPSKEAFENDLPLILIKLGFSKEKAAYITDKIAVDASRGAGHAWGSMMKGDKAHLRTRIGADGMNYKGYNIAVHEFGHNVEQTLDLYDIDYYMLNGVPNTAFTEALAFIFQKRDLDLLMNTITDKKAETEKESLLTLDNFWSIYEIMGVSIVDMNVWKWLYENPAATPEELRTKVIIIAKDTWNKYYADVFGIKDQPILAIYSHMIDAPLYLSAYPIGHLIDFQIEGQLKGRNFGSEIQRIYTQGKLTPEVWMPKAVGNKISINPMLKAVDEALLVIK